MSADHTLSRVPGEPMRYALALDLADDPQLIAEYERYHQAVWPEVLAHLQAQGVTRMDIYRLGTRMFMLMEVDPTRYTPERMRQASENDPVIQRWEELMWTFQRPTPWTPDGEKWVFMKPVFEWSPVGS